MRQECEPSFYANIYIAGDYETAKSTCRIYCERGA